MFITDYNTTLFTAEENRELFTELLEEGEWGQDGTACYGKGFLPWTNALLDIKQYLEDKFDVRFDAVILTRSFDKNCIKISLSFLTPYF